jgi:hypothetical protein
MGTSRCEKRIDSQRRSLEKPDLLSSGVGVEGDHGIIGGLVRRPLRMDRRASQGYEHVEMSKVVLLCAAVYYTSLFRLRCSKLAGRSTR